MTTIRPVILELLAALILALGLPGSGLAQGTRGSEDIPIFHAMLDESARARFVERRFEDHGREFVVYKLKMDDLDERVVCAVGCGSGKAYRIEREKTGTGKWMGLMLGNLLMYSGIAEDLRFEPVTDWINGDAGVNATELLQMTTGEQIKGLLHAGGGLEDVDNTLSATYAFSARDRALVMAPNALHFVEGAAAADGSPLENAKSADIFTKHAFLARILNEEQKVDMAGELYMRIVPKAGVPTDEIFSEGRIDLDKIHDRETGILDVGLVDIELVVKNDSGTFKPGGRGIVAFTWTFMKALRANQIGFEAFGPEGRSGVVVDQGHATWEAFRVANPALTGG